MRTRRAGLSTLVAALLAPPASADAKSSAQITSLKSFTGVSPWGGAADQPEGEGRRRQDAR